MVFWVWDVSTGCVNCIHREKVANLSVGLRLDSYSPEIGRKNGVFGTFGPKFGVLSC